MNISPSISGGSFNNPKVPNLVWFRRGDPTGVENDSVGEATEVSELLRCFLASTSLDRLISLCRRNGNSHTDEPLFDLPAHAREGFTSILTIHISQEPAVQPAPQHIEP